MCRWMSVLPGLMIVVLLPACLERTGLLNPRASGGCTDACTPDPTPTPDNPTPALQLRFVSQPSPTAAVLGDFAQAPVVAAQDSSGQTVATAAASITLTAYADEACTIPAAGTLKAAVNPVATSAGVAAFASVSYALAGSPLFLGASAPGLLPACSTRVTMLLLTKPLGVPTGRIIACGDFDGYVDTTTHAVGRGILRVNADGTLDPSFNSGGAGANRAVYNCLPEIDSEGIPTGKIIIGGAFDRYNGAAVPGCGVTGPSPALYMGFQELR